VRLYVCLTEEHIATHATRHVVGDALVESVAGLAICTYEADPGFYIFYCGPEWQVITDTFHETLHAAQGQAEFEFTGVSSSWLER